MFENHFKGQLVGRFETKAEAANQVLYLHDNWKDNGVHEEHAPHLETKAGGRYELYCRGSFVRSSDAPTFEEAAASGVNGLDTPFAVFDTQSDEDLPDWQIRMWPASPPPEDLPTDVAWSGIQAPPPPRT